MLRPRRQAVNEHWKAQFPQRAIMKQLGMSKTTLMRILAFAKGDPANPIAV
jgi:hypothetical protein